MVDAVFGSGNTDQVWDNATGEVMTRVLRLAQPTGEQELTDKIERPRKRTQATLLANGFTPPFRDWRPVSSPVS
jgi:hypothetical protein